MSTLANEALYETCFDESFDEYMRISGLSSDQMSEWVSINPYVLDLIENKAYKMFQDMCQQANCPLTPLQGFIFCYIKDMNKNLEIVRSFFTDAEWDAIDSALSDYQDYGDRETELMNSIGDKMDKLFNA